MKRVFVVICLVENCFKASAFRYRGGVQQALATYRQMSPNDVVAILSLDEFAAMLFVAHFNCKNITKEQVLSLSAMPSSGNLIPSLGGFNPITDFGLSALFLDFTQGVLFTLTRTSTFAGYVVSARYVVMLNHVFNTQNSL